jgi:catalase (peroxidase I)
MSNLKNYQIKAIAKKIYAEHQEELKKGQPSLNDAYIALREDKAFRTLLETFAKVVNTFKKSFEMKKEQLEEMGFFNKRYFLWVTYN